MDIKTLYSIRKSLHKQRRQAKRLRLKAEKQDLKNQLTAVEKKIEAYRH